MKMNKISGNDVNGGLEEYCKIARRIGRIAMGRVIKTEVVAVLKSSEKLSIIFMLKSVGDRGRHD